jgi:hypothetical protein
VAGIAYDLIDRQPSPYQEARLDFAVPPIAGFYAGCGGSTVSQRERYHHYRPSARTIGIFNYLSPAVVVRM